MIFIRFNRQFGDMLTGVVTIGFAVKANTNIFSLTEKEILTPSLRNFTNAVYRKCYIMGCLGFVTQGHLCFSWCPVSLLGIAFRTGAHQIFPGVSTTECFGYYMISGHNRFANTAVLTDVVIAAEDIPFG